MASFMKKRTGSKAPERKPAKREAGVRNDSKRESFRRPDRPGTTPVRANEEKSTAPPVVFGVLPVFEALKAGARRVEKVLIADGANERRLNEIITLARENGIPFQRVPKINLTRLAGEDANHQGVVAYAAAADYYDSRRLVEEIGAEIRNGGKPLVLILDGVEDPRNLGAILRTAECAGVTGVFIPERRAVGLNETVAKSSAGAAEYVKVAKVTNLNRLIEELKSMNVWVVGSSLETTQAHTGWDWNQPTALVMGSEGKGLHRLVAENCDSLIMIPMMGKIESLNVSVATGVILFEANRQRSC